MTSTDSLTTELPPAKPPAEPSVQPPLTPEQELQRGIRLQENLKRMLHMASIKSIRSTMGWEQKAVEQQTKMDQEAIGDEESASQAATADTNADGVEVDEMEEWVAGDKTITTHNHFHPKADAAPAQTSATTSAPTATTSAPAASNSVLPTLLVGAAMLAGGTGLGYVVNDLLKPQPPDAVSTGIDTDTTLGIHLPP